MDNETPGAKVANRAVFLSRLVLNPLEKQVQRDLSDCHSLHRTVMSAFPEVRGDEIGPREQFGVLHRVDVDPRSGRVVLLVQTLMRPDWLQVLSKFPEYLLRSERENPSVKDIGPIFATLSEGRTLTFRLRANPTKKVDTRSGPDGKRRNGRRVELTGEAERNAWMARKAAEGGFEILAVRGTRGIPDIRITPGRSVGLGKSRPAPSGETRTAASQAKLVFASVTFDGTLRIRDADAFRDTLIAGLGTAKAFGHGLLSIAPLRSA